MGGRRARGLPRLPGEGVRQLDAQPGEDGADAAELTYLRAFFSLSRVYSITARISRRAFEILGRQSPPAGLTADDALVAATALDCKLPLYTLDPGRFSAVAGLTVLRPY